MNIVDIKKRVKEEFYINRDIDFYEAQEDISYLLSIIEQAEKALIEFTDKHFQGGSKSDREDYSVMVSCADIYRLREALQAIRKGD